MGKRTFDHDEARARYEAGEPVLKLSQAYGVSLRHMYYVVTGVRRRTDNEARAEARRKKREREGR